MVEVDEAGGKSDSDVWNLVGSRRALSSNRNLEKPAASWPSGKEVRRHESQAPECPRVLALGERPNLVQTIKKLWSRAAHGPEWRL